MQNSLGSLKHLKQICQKSTHANGVHLLSTLFARAAGSLVTTQSSHALEMKNVEPLQDRPQLGNPGYDKEEVAKFSKMAKEWWNPNGPMAPLHSMNPTRVKFIRNTISTHFRKDLKSPFPLKGLKIADIGCGAGLLSEPLARLGGKIVGVDASSEAIQIAKSHSEADESLASNLSYIESTAENLQQTGEKFDAVIASEIIEHLQDLEGFCNALSGLLREKGVAVISTLNRTPRAYLMAILGAERILRLLPNGTHDWNKFITPDELVMMAKGSGLELQEIQGMTLNPLSQKWSLTDDLGVNYIASFVKK